MARKHEKFSHCGYRYAPEQWRFYYNGKYIRLESQEISNLAQMVIAGKKKEAEDVLKRLLRKEEKRPNDLVTFAFYGENSELYYFTQSLSAHRSDLSEKLKIYKKWKRYIREECKGILKQYVVTSGCITPYGAEQTQEERRVVIDFSRPGRMIRLVRKGLFT